MEPEWEAPSSITLKPRDTDPDAVDALFLLHHPKKHQHPSEAVW